ncbi:MAG: YHS domain-containing (seleno)protein [Cyclobacteriaceae bacterium]
MMLKRTLCLLLFSVAFLTVHSQHKYSCSDEEVAFGGNDLVSYFKGDVVKGSERYTTQYDGLKLQFNNYDNMLEFKKNPDKYMPKYGGWCATAVVNERFVKPDYNMFKIQDGSLLFFEVKAFFNGKTQWDKNPEINEIVADKKYKEKNIN